MFGLISNNRAIRRITTSFGSLFTNIVMVRYDNSGIENSRIIVPVQMGQKEKFVQILEGDPLDDKSIQISLPILSYSLKGINYDSSRKNQSTIMNYSYNSNTGLNTQYTPVPYDFDFEVCIYVRNIEDGTQIIEQILPFFTPDYTIRVVLSPQLNIIKDIPIVIDNITYEVSNDGNKSTETRSVIWTLNFKVKGWLFGPASINTNGIIKETITNLYYISSSQNINLVMNLHTGNGNYQLGEIVFQSNNTIQNADATAKVSNWSNTTGKLFITDIQGNFSTSIPVYGVVTGTNYIPINYEIGNAY